MKRIGPIKSLIWIVLSIQFFLGLRIQNTAAGPFRFPETFERPHPRLISRDLDQAKILNAIQASEDERDLKEHLAKRNSQFARTIVCKLMTYAVGRSMTFRDERAIQELLNEVGGNDCRLRHLVLSVVASKIFAMK